MVFARVCLPGFNSRLAVACPLASVSFIYHRHHANPDSTAVPEPAPSNTWMPRQSPPNGFFAAEQGLNHKLDLSRSRSSSRSRINELHFPFLTFLRVFLGGGRREFFSFGSLFPWIFLLLPASIPWFCFVSFSLGPLLL